MFQSLKFTRRHVCPRLETTENELTSQYEIADENQQYFSSLCFTVYHLYHSIDNVVHNFRLDITMSEPENKLNWIKNAIWNSIRPTACHLLFFPFQL